MTKPPGRRRLPLRGVLWGLGGPYVVLLVLMLIAAVTHTTPASVLAALSRPEIRESLLLTLGTSTLATALALIVATPLAYEVSRLGGGRRRALEALLDLPNLLPPLAIGLLLLIAFQRPPLDGAARWVVYEPLGVVLAQMVIAASFVLPAVTGAFDQIPSRAEQVARVLGASPTQAFWLVTLPQAKGALATSAAIGWARAVGTFGPVLVFAGAVRGKTEVLSTSIYLELNAGELNAAMAVTLLLIAASTLALAATRAVAGRSTRRKVRREARRDD